MRDRLIRVSQALVLAVSVFIVGYTLYQGRSELVRYSTQIDLRYFLAGTVLIPVQMLMKRYGWRRVMHHLGEELEFSRAMSLISLFQVGSYIPGGVWHFIGISYWGEQAGLEKKKTFYGAVLNAMINLAVGLTVFVIFGLFLFEQLGVLRYFIGGAAVIGLFIFLRAGIYFRVINIVLDLFGRENLRERTGSYALMEVGSIHFLARMVEGASIFLLIYAVTPIELGLLIPVIGISAGTWALGFLVFFMPSGAGVKEVSMIQMFGLIIPVSVAALIAVASRVLYIFWEVLIAALFVYLAEGKLRLQ